MLFNLTNSLTTICKQNHLQVTINEHEIEKLFLTKNSNDSHTQGLQSVFSFMILFNFYVSMYCVVPVVSFNRFRCVHLWVTLSQERKINIFDQLSTTTLIFYFFFFYYHGTVQMRIWLYNDNPVLDKFFCNQINIQIMKPTNNLQNNYFVFIQWHCLCCCVAIFNTVYS